MGDKSLKGEGGFYFRWNFRCASARHPYASVSAYAVLTSSLRRRKHSNPTATVAEKNRNETKLFHNCTTTTANHLSRKLSHSTLT